MDPSLNHVTSKSAVVQNYAGLLGAYISGFLSDVFGIAAYVWPVVFGAVGVACIAPRYELLWWRWLGYFLLTLCALFVGAAWEIQLGEIHGGGMVGNTLFQHAIRFLSPWGSWILWLFLFTMATQLTFGISWANLYKKAHVYCTQRLRALPLLALPQGSSQPNQPHQQGQTLQSNTQPTGSTEPTRQGPLHMAGVAAEHTKTTATAEPIKASWLEKLSRFSLKNSGSTNTASTNVADVAPPSSHNMGSAVKSFFQGIKEKMRHKAQVAPMPEIYDVETIHIDDPNIKIVPPQSYAEQDTSFSVAPPQNASPTSPMDSSCDTTVHAQVPPCTAQETVQVSVVSSAATTAKQATSPAVHNAESSLDEAPLTLTPAPPMQEQEEPKKKKGLFSFKKQEKASDAVTNVSRSASTDVHQQPASAAHVAVADTATPKPQPDDIAVKPTKTVAATPPTPTATSLSSVEIVSATPPSTGAVTSSVPAVSNTPNTTVPRTASVPRKYAFPPISLLQSALPSSPKAHDIQIQRGQALMSCLSDFSIQGELVRITPGPVVTMYEVRPAAGIRVNKIANLTDDIALALKAIAIRIQAPIPGSDTVGIEIPNVDREMVNFREVLESPEFTNAGGPLNMVLGKNIAGHPFVAELSKMPHLLVAGATGAGKSVGLNAILLSLLYTTQPNDMQLLLIDPKRIEMAVYADLPHLVHPVVTEMQHAKTALEWAVHEMDKRYEAMAKVQVRNIISYNQKVQALAELPAEEVPAELADMEHMPYLVIIIDELADLMLTAAREVETSIVRLAQLARAAGIHMILATQRPSVDVVTGIIKANFPCRISFQVTSKHDSRTILDMVGAEHLLGRGDMLYKPSGGRLMRLHGPFVPDEEVQAVVAHWKRQAPPAYKVDFSQWGNEQAEGKSGAFSDMSNDPLYAEVRAFVEEQGKVSISLVQRRFKIGFNKAAVMVEQLEHDGIIGPADGSKPRTLIR